jgi:hypothetical protein
VPFPALSLTSQMFRILPSKKSISYLLLISPSLHHPFPSQS